MKSIRVTKQSDLLCHNAKGRPPLCLTRNTKLVVEASAGTGKTFALEELVLELALVEGIPFQKILLVTFTEKATNDLRKRLRNRLRELVDLAEGRKKNPVRPLELRAPAFSVFL